MSKILKNKQLIHVAVEVVVLVGLVYYVSSKNKKLMNHIEDLAQRVEEQDEQIEKHEQIIRQLVDAMNRINPPRPTPVSVKKESKKVVRIQEPVKEVPLAPPPSPGTSPGTSRSQSQSPTLSPQTVSIPDVVSKIEEVSDEQLDAEIESELQELKNDSEK